MSDAKTTADLFRERGWGVGTRVQHEHFNGVETIEAIGADWAITRSAQGEPSCWTATVDRWSLYTPTPPVPTQDEWRELWPMMKAWRSRVVTAVAWPASQDLALAIDAIAAKGDAA